MNPKNFFFSLLIICLAALQTPVFAVGDPSQPLSKDMRSQQLEERLMQIKEMDKSQLTHEQKKQLRKEVKEIRYEERHNGVYISIGALIIIILLLIILL